MLVNNNSLRRDRNGSEQSKTIRSLLKKLFSSISRIFSKSSEKSYGFIKFQEFTELLSELFDDVKISRVETNRVHRYSAFVPHISRRWIQIEIEDNKLKLAINCFPNDFEESAIEKDTNLKHIDSNKGSTSYKVVPNRDTVNINLCDEEDYDIKSPEFKRFITDIRNSFNKVSGRR